MSDVTVTKGSNNQWTYTPLMYWPVSNSLNFFSYAPTSITAYTAPATANGAATFSNYKNSGTQDLLYGVNMNLSYTPGSSSGDSQVKISMNHALSQIKFAINNKAGVSTYARIFGVNLVNVSKQGTFTFPTATTNADVKGTWTALSPASESYEVYSGDGSKYSTPKNDKGSAVNIPTTNFEFVIPQNIQTFTASTDKNANPTGTYVAVKCIICDAKTNTPVWPRPTTPGYDAKTQTALIYFPLDNATATGTTPTFTAWQAGCSYVYTLNISVPDNEGAILFGEVNVNPYSEFTASVENESN